MREAWRKTGEHRENTGRTRACCTEHRCVEMEEMEESGRAEQTRWGCPVAYVPVLFDTQGTRGAGVVLGSTHARSLAPGLPP